MRSPRTAVALGMLTAALAVPATGGGAAAASSCLSPDQPSPVVTDEPWAAQVLDPAAVWAHSTGAGVLVAVIDSGVDAGHRQLDAPGKVLGGVDLVGGLDGGNVDCASHGTAVASIIAADPEPGVGFAGLAPGARILPIRLTERAADLDSPATAGIAPATVARAIRHAADAGASVINLSLAGADRDRKVAAAVRYARKRDVLLVASAGNAGPQDGASRPTYPAAYPGVLGVGATDIAGMRLAGSQVGPQVDLVAPGGGVLAATRVRGHRYWAGTSFAAPFVSATAALVRAAWPDLTASQVAERILATASPAPGGAGSPAYGAGLVNPYRAVTDRLDGAAPAPIPAARPTPVDPVAVAESVRAERSRERALLAGGAAGGLAVGGLVVGLILARGRGRNWRAAPARPAPAEPDRPEPPEEIFLIPRHSR